METRDEAFEIYRQLHALVDLSTASLQLLSTPAGMQSVLHLSRRCTSTVQLHWAGASYTIVDGSEKAQIPMQQPKTCGMIGLLAFGSGKKASKPRSGRSRLCLCRAFNINCARLMNAVRLQCASCADANFILRTRPHCPRTRENNEHTKQQQSLMFLDGALASVRDLFSPRHPEASST